MSVSLFAPLGALVILLSLPESSVLADEDQHPVVEKLNSSSSQVREQASQGLRDLDIEEFKIFLDEIKDDLHGGEFSAKATYRIGRVICERVVAEELELEAVVRLLVSKEERLQGIGRQCVRENLEGLRPEVANYLELRGLSIEEEAPGRVVTFQPFWMGDKRTTALLELAGPYQGINIDTGSRDFLAKIPKLEPARLSFGLMVDGGPLGEAELNVLAEILEGVGNETTLRVSLYYTEISNYSLVRERLVEMLERFTNLSITIYGWEEEPIVTRDILRARTRTHADITVSRGGYLGVLTSMQNIDGQQCLRINSVFGEKAMEVLRLMDLVCKVNDQDITHESSLRDAINSTAVGDEIKLGIRRGDSEEVIAIQLDEAVFYQDSSYVY